MDANTRVAEVLVESRYGLRFMNVGMVSARGGSERDGQRRLLVVFGWLVV